MFGVLSCTKIGCHARPGASGYDLTGCKPWPPEDGARWAPISDGEGDTHENYGASFGYVQRPRSGGIHTEVGGARSPKVGNQPEVDFTE